MQKSRSESGFFKLVGDRGLLATAWLALRAVAAQRSLAALESNLLPPEVLILFPGCMTRPE